MTHPKRGEDEVLPGLEEHQEFICGGGCGECDPVEFDYLYSEEVTADGEVIKKTSKAYKSDCCGSLIDVWDEEKDDVIDLEW